MSDIETGAFVSPIPSPLPSPLVSLDEQPRIVVIKLWDNAHTTKVYVPAVVLPLRNKRVLVDLASKTRAKAQTRGEQWLREHLVDGDKLVDEEITVEQAVTLPQSTAPITEVNHV